MLFDKPFASRCWRFQKPCKLWLYCTLRTEKSLYSLLITKHSQCNLFAFKMIYIQSMPSFSFFCFGTLNSPSACLLKLRFRGWSHELEKISDLKYCKRVNTSRSHHGLHSQFNLSPESYSTCRLSYPIRDSLEVSFVLNYFQKSFLSPHTKFIIID